MKMNEVITQPVSNNAYLGVASHLISSHLISFVQGSRVTFQMTTNYERQAGAQ